MSKVSPSLIGWLRSRDPELVCDWSESRNVEWRNPLEMTSDRCIIRINEMPGPGTAVRGLTPTLRPGPGSWRVRWGRKCRVPGAKYWVIVLIRSSECEKTWTARCIMQALTTQVSKHCVTQIKNISRNYCDKWPSIKVYFWCQSPLRLIFIVCTIDNCLAIGFMATEKICCALKSWPALLGQWGLVIEL